jgi:UDP-glucose 4-epimerase
MARRGRPKTTSASVASARPPARRVVALTGASDPLGTGLIAHLERDDRYRKLVAIDIRLPKIPMEKTRFVKLDLTQPTAAQELEEVLAREEVDTFVHLAYLSNPTHNSAWAHELEALGTMHVLTAVGERRLPKLVAWGHTCVYGAHPGNPNFLTEDHRLQGNLQSRFVRDKLEADCAIRKFAESHPNTVVTLLRTASIVGPRIRNYVTRYFSRKFVPTLWGFDPLMQFVHEDDVLRAFEIAILRDHPGTFNIVGAGVERLSTLLKLAGRIAIPIPHPLAYPLVHALWTVQAVEAPGMFLDYLRYLWVADGAKAREQMGFVPGYSTRDAFLSFARGLELQGRLDRLEEKRERAEDA